MSPSRTLFVGLLLLAGMNLTGCGSSETPEPAREEDKALQRAIQEPLDKARAVEDTLQKQQEAMQRQIDEDGG